MSETKLKEENEFIKELFNFNGDEAQFKHIKELFTNYIRNSKNGPKTNWFPKILLSMQTKSKNSFQRTYGMRLFLFSRTN